MLTHIKQTDDSVPYRDGDWWYYSRTEEGLQYSIHCRKHARPAGPTRRPDAIPNRSSSMATARRGPGLLLHRRHRHHRRRPLLAYTTDTTGFRQYTLHIKDLATGETLPGAVERVGSVTWAADNSHALLLPSKTRSRSARSSSSATPSARRTSTTSSSIRTTTSASTSASAAPATANSSSSNPASHTTTESRVLPADEPTGEFTLIAPREDEHEYSVDHRNGLFYIRTNDRGRNFRLVTAPVATPGREHWTELIPHRDAVMLEDFDLFASFFVACEREDGLPRLRLWTLQRRRAPRPSRPAKSPSPSPPTAPRPHINRIFETTHIPLQLSVARHARVRSTSTTSQPRESTLLKQQEVPGGFDRTLYASERVHATAPDGVQVPISLVYRKGQTRTAAANPLYVYGYGSYGYPLPARLQLEPPQPARSRRRHGLRPHPRRRRPRRPLARRRQDAGQAQHLHRLHRRRRAPHRQRLRRPSPRRHRRRLRRRPADGRRHQPPPRSLPRRPLPRPLRRHHEHHARRFPAPHRPRVRRVGQSQRGDVTSSTCSATRPTTT